MGFFKKLFSKKEENLPPYFQIQKNFIHDPSLWSEDISEVANKVTAAEKEYLVKICELLQKSISNQYFYISNSEICVQKINKNSDYYVKSYFELTVLNWVLVTNYFKANNIRDEVGQTLWWINMFSFSEFGHIFKSTSFGSYEAAFGDRHKLYIKLLGLFFKPRQNEMQVYQNLFEVLINNPLTDKTSELDFMRVSMDYFKNTDLMLNSAVFNQGLAKEITNFSKSLNQIKL